MIYIFVLGPSYTIDTACSSSLLALDQALHSIKQGHCDSAIVGGSNLCLKPTTALQFQNLGMLSPDGTCKSFDEQGNLKYNGVHHHTTWYPLMLICNGNASHISSCFFVKMSLFQEMSTICWSLPLLIIYVPKCNKNMKNAAAAKLGF